MSVLSWFCVIASSHSGFRLFLDSLRRHIWNAPVFKGGRLLPSAFVRRWISETGAARSNNLNVPPLLASPKSHPLISHALLNDDWKSPKELLDCSRRNASVWVTHSSAFAAAM